MKKSLGINVLSLFILSFPLLTQAQLEALPLTVDDLMALDSVSNPQLSPDGEWVAYVVRSRDMEEDKSNSQIFMVASAGS
ncbi:MAG TPA: S9 family peptidase, partial [Gammaproteobacteria bacterium]|nr:S9 family peptidase [Gammaproteobacteria bacterium]